jgi:hypothetical protein
MRAKIGVDVRQRITMKPYIESSRLLELFFIFGSGIFLFLNTFTINADDLGIYYSNDISTALWEVNYINYRYLTAAFVAFLGKLGLDYLNIIGLLCLTLPLALALCVRQLLLILALPEGLLAPCGAAILLHGLWADLHPFTMAYGNFTLALIFVSLSLAAVRRLQLNVAAFSTLAILSGLAVLFTYQPFLLILPLAAGLMGLRLITSAGDQWTIHEARRLGLILVAVFIIASIVFFIFISIFAGSPSSGNRPVSIANIPRNILPYLHALGDQIFSRGTRFGTIFPFHERAVYGLVLPAAILFIAAAGWRRSNGVMQVFGLGASLAGTLLAAGPFNLLGEVFWPSGRSTSPIAFFHVLGTAFILLFAARKAETAGFRWNALIPYAATVFIGLSFASQLSLCVERVRQLRQDWAIGQTILDEVRKKSELHDDLQVAVVATWRNIAQLRRSFFLDYGASAFSTPWSSVPMLSLLSGYRLKPADIPKSVCANFRAPLEVRQQGEVFVACME